MSLNEYIAMGFFIVAIIGLVVRISHILNKKVSYENMLETIRKEYILLHNHLLSKIPELQNLLKESFKFQAVSKSSYSRSSKKFGGKQNQYRTKGKNNFPCPVCSEGSLIERTNSRTNEKFYGCSRYPSCSFTSPRVKRKDNTFGPASHNK